MSLRRYSDFATTAPDQAPTNDGACTGSGAGDRQPAGGSRQRRRARASTLYRTVTNLRPCTGVDYVLIVQNRPKHQNRKAPENINVFRGFFGCGGRI
ncbi:MAG: hypothetical protein OXH92_21275 [Bryobacterales bacterium]|nr:hypothetical protein [Bryobacterales bacterium]